METFFFVGFEGSGKKTMASLLSSRKNIQHIDIEKLIEQDEKTSSFNIQKFKGNDYYNTKVKNILTDIPFADNTVSTTTFLVSDEENRNLMLKKGRVVYLKASANTIVDHLKDNIENVPLLKDNFNEEYIQKLIDQLDDEYRRSASYTIDVDDKNINEVFNEVLFYHNTVNMLNCHIHIK